MVDFVRWYNYQHRHSGLAFLTPADVHFGRSQEVLAKRNVAMQQVWQQHPRRFHSSGPATHTLPSAVYINKPMEDQQQDAGSALNEIATTTIDRCLTNA
jgi:putative transposase